MSNFSARVCLIPTAFMTLYCRNNIYNQGWLLAKEPPKSTGPAILYSAVNYARSLIPDLVLEGWSTFNIGAILYCQVFSVVNKLTTDLQK